LDIVIALHEQNQNHSWIVIALHEQNQNHSWIVIPLHALKLAAGVHDSIATRHFNAT
jgi:hypothetical protein